MAGKSPYTLWSLWHRDLGLSEDRLALTSMSKIRHYFSSKLSETPITNLSKLSLQPALCKQSPCNCFKHCHEKHGAGSMGTSAVPQHGVTKHRCCNTDISFPVWEGKHKQLWSPHSKQNISECQHKLGKGRERLRKTQFADKSLG